MLRAISVVALLIATTTNLVADDLELVGPLGDPAHWGFTGDLHYDVADLRSALAGDFEVLLASRPQAPRERLLAILKAALERGFRSKGFAEPVVTVKVHPTGERLICDIAAGRQYVNERIEIHGASEISVEDLRAAMTKDAPPGVTVPIPIPGHKTTATGQAVEGNSVPYTGPFWIPGEKSSFTPFARAFARQATIDALRRIGWFDPILDVEFRPEPDGKATLQVNIADEGTRAVLGDIDVEGVVKNTPRQVIDYLGLEVGQPLNAALEAELRTRLAASNRFHKPSVEIIPPPFGNAPCRLIIHVKESRFVPPLGEEFTPLQQRALRMAESMQSQQDADWEFTVRYPPQVDGDPTGIIRLHVSAHDGIALFELLAIDREERILWNPKFLADERRTVFLSGDGQRKLEFPLIDSQASFSLLFTPNTDGDETLSTIALGAGVNSRPENSVLPIKVSVGMEPLDAIRKFSQTGMTMEESGDETIIRHEDKVLVIDRRTDDFRSMLGVGKDGHEDSIIAVSCRPGRLKAVWPELMSAVDRAESAQLTDLPVTSLLRFLLAESQQALRAVGDPVPPSLELWDRILAARSLESLDRWALSEKTKEKRPPSRFSIPPTWSERQGTRTPEWLSFGLKWGWSQLNELVPRDTPLWVMGREAMFLVLRPPGVTPARPEELAVLLRDAEAGPLQCAIAAEAFGQLHPVYRHVLANAGREHLERAKFQRDVELLTDERGLVGQVLRSVTTAFRDVDDADIAVLTARLGPAVQRVAVELRQRNNEPLNTVLVDLAGQHWEPVAKPLLATWLENLANR